MIRFQPHKLCAHLPCFFQIERELLFMVSLLVLGIEARHVELAVVLDLQRVKAAKHLYLAVEAAEGVCLFRAGSINVMIESSFPVYLALS